MRMAAVVYGLFDAREATKGDIFYVGMGSRKRPFRHLSYANSERGHVNFRMQEMLADHLIHGLEPDVVILAECDEYEEAIEIERDLISTLGRKDIDPDGVLLNIQPGWAGDKTDWRVPIEIRSAHTSAMNSRLWSDLEHRTARCLSMRKPKLKTAKGAAARLLNLEGAWTVESRAKVSAAIKARWASPEFVARMSSARKTAWENPDLRANMLTGRSEGIAASWRDPEVRQKRTRAVSEAISEKWADPEYAEKARAGLRAAWADPEKKAARIAKMLESRRAKGVVVSPEVRAKRSETMKAVNARMTAEQRSAIQAKSWEDPAVREARIAGIKSAAAERAPQQPEGSVPDAEICAEGDGGHID